MSQRYSPKKPGNFKFTCTVWPDTGRALQQIADDDDLTISGAVHQLLRSHPRIKPLLDNPE